MGLNALADFWPQWPVGIEWLAIGQSTAGVALHQLIEPIVPKQETSEGLLQLPQLQQLQARTKIIGIKW